jgi:hypothetical protein
LITQGSLRAPNAVLGACEGFSGMRRHAARQ